MSSGSAPDRSGTIALSPTYCYPQNPTARRSPSHGSEQAERCAQGVPATLQVVDLAGDERGELSSIGERLLQGRLAPGQTRSQHPERAVERRARYVDFRGEVHNRFIAAGSLDSRPNVSSSVRWTIARRTHTSMG